MFLEQDGSGGETLELIAKFFPREIEVRTTPVVASSGEGGKKGKKTRTRKDSKGFVAKNSQNEKDGDEEEQVETIVEGATKEEEPETPNAVEKKVGIVSQQLSIFPSQYSTGIAIKP